MRFHRIARSRRAKLPAKGSQRLAVFEEPTVDGRTRSRTFGVDPKACLQAQPATQRVGVERSLCGQDPSGGRLRFRRVTAPRLHIHIYARRSVYNNPTKTPGTVPGRSRVYWNRVVERLSFTPNNVPPATKRAKPLG
jgi:hypothetical protein